jgi:hypothetical protein
MSPRKPRRVRRQRCSPIEIERVRGEDSDRDAPGLVSLPIDTPLVASFDGTDGTMSIETPVLAAEGCEQAFMLRLLFSAEAVDGFLRALEAFEHTGGSRGVGIARARRH